MKDYTGKIRSIMNKKNYFRAAGILFIIFLLQLVYFNAIAINHADIIKSQKSRLDSLSSTIDHLQGQLNDNPRQSYVNAHQINGLAIFCGDTLDLQNQHLRESLEREFYSLLSEQGQIQLYLKRGTKYTEMIERQLTLSGLPSDLKYLAIHESALLPRIKSKSNAVGLWQFMRSTGRLYGLKIDHYIDERRDPERATVAAIRLLKELYRYYGNWALVMAAYNGGHGRVSRALEAQKARSFFDLSLPEETERYYFKIVATKILLENAVRYGFKIDDNDMFKPVPVITINHEVRENKKYLDQISEQYEMSLAEFKFINPKFVSPYLPRGIYEINLPLDRQHLVITPTAEDISDNDAEKDIDSNLVVTE